MSIRLSPVSVSAAVLLAALLPAVSRAAGPAAPRVGPAQARVITCVYDVGKLTAPPVCVDGPGPKAAPDAKPRTALGLTDGELVSLIVGTVKPNTWEVRGGTGTIKYYPKTGGLVVTHTADVLEEVGDLLESLRRLGGVRLAIDVRVLTIRETLCPCLGLNAEENGAKCLTEAGLFWLLEAAQGDPRSSVTSMPKLELLNGQFGCVNVATDEKTLVTGVDVRTRDGLICFIPHLESKTAGLRVAAQPVVSTDLRNVRLALKIEQTDLVPVPGTPVTVLLKDEKGEPLPLAQHLQQPAYRTQAIDNPVTVPDGGTVVLGGFKATAEARDEFGPPVIGQVPYVGRLFRNVGYGRTEQRVFYLVTPRKVEPVAAEEKRPQAGFRPAPRIVECTAAAPARVPEGRAPVPAKDRCANALAELLKAYDAACAEGRAAEAGKLAQAALLLDPTCFKGRSRD